MKTLAKSLLNLLVWIPFCLFSQVWEWTSAVPLTDSLTDNRNAILADVEFYDGNDIYIFWEKSFDSTSTHIYTKGYYSSEDPIAVVEGDHHSINPCILNTSDWSYPQNEPSFYLFYLSDQDGDFDIYYRTYSAEGWSEEVVFANTEGDEKHLVTNAINNLAWEYEGNIMHSRLEKVNNGPFYFTDILVVDSGDCKKPVLEPIPSFYFGGFLAWERVINDSSKVMLSEWNYADDWWGNPMMVYDTGHCTNLRFEESTSSEVAATLSWDMLDSGSGRKTVSFDPFYQDYLMLDLDQEQESFPTVFNIFVGVADTWFFAVFSFVKGDDEQTDIYGGYHEPLWPGAYVNLSASSANETNPRLWNGYLYYDYQDVINVWESNRNGHWQLWTSKIQVPISGSVPEKTTLSTDLLNVFPNPFADQVNVSFISRSDRKGKLELFDHKGRKLIYDDRIDVIQGENCHSLNINEMAGTVLPDGIYFLKLEVGSEILSGKLIKTEP
ncbi:MAG: T9SS type A sorting domain-containing protein [Bacteroidales bacterium]|jgi:hypothetical protein|nr:T9SS type A sorting domain-containing protein [Bacteroidales bacterium]